MIQIRKANDRGETNLGWLKSRHSFSFSNYHDPQNVHFRHLRVINDDYIAPSGGFGMHPHNDMEIITFIHNGKIAHKDSIGNGSVIQQGEIQKMTAGTGIMHSEFNPSETEELHLYQIWIFPDKKGLKPSYEQITYDRSKALNDFLLVASNKPNKNSVTINQDVSLYLSIVEKDNSIKFPIDEGRNVWVQVVDGSADINGNFISTGDGVAITNERLLEIGAIEDSEILLFDLN